MLPPGGVADVERLAPRRRLPARDVPEQVTGQGFGGRLGGFEAEMPRDEVDRALHRERSFRPAGAAIGRVRHFVRDDDAARGGKVLDLVGSRQMHGGVIRDARANRVPGAAIDEIVVVEREDMAPIVEADFDIVPLVARMRRAHQMLTALLDPTHRPAEAMREEGHEEVFGIDVPLAAKAAADIERDATHARLGNSEQRRRLAPHPVYDLRRGPDRR